MGDWFYPVLAIGIVVGGIVGAVLGIRSAINSVIAKHLNLGVACVSLLLLGSLPAFAQTQTAPLNAFTLTLTPEEVEMAFQALRAVPRPAVFVDPLMLKIQQQVADQNKAAQEANAKAHAEAVQKDKDANP